MFLAAGLEGAKRVFEKSQVLGLPGTDACPTNPWPGFDSSASSPSIPLHSPETQFLPPIQNEQGMVMLCEWQQVK